MQPGQPDTDNARQNNGKVTQMSHGWIETRLKTIVLTDSVALADMQKRLRASYARHVLFFSAPQIVAHAEALSRLVLHQRVDPSFHGAHEITRAWDDAAIEKVVDNRAGFKSTDRDARNRVRKTK
jgi:hypothetical protein